MRLLSFKDLINNIRYAIKGLSIEVRDPFKKMEIEKQLAIHEIKYLGPSYDSSDGVYMYAIIGGKNEKIEEFIKWFTSSDYRYYVNKHAIFHTKLLCLVKM